MATEEGLRRIYTLIKLIRAIVLGIVIAFLGIQLIPFLLPGGGAKLSVAELAITTAISLIFGGGVWAITWIVEGFVRPRSQAAPQS